MQHVVLGRRPVPDGGREHVIIVHGDGQGYHGSWGFFGGGHGALQPTGPQNFTQLYS